jgi:hypothetical protein
MYKDGMLWKAVGAVGNVSIATDVGTAPTATFTLSAAYIAPVVAAVPSGAAYDATEPVVASSADVVSDGATIAVGAFSIDAGNDVQEHRTTNFHEFTVADRAPTMTFTKDSLATAAEWTALRSGTDAALSCVRGATAGNITTISAPAGRRQSVAYGERAERDTTDVTYGLFESASDDQFSVAFT